MGPIASFGHRDRIIGMVQQAVDQGAQVLTGARVPTGPGMADGAWYAPTILAGMAADAPIAQEEIFGPVLCALPFDDEADLIAQANGTAFGLAAGIWCADYRRALRIARDLQAGTVWINTYKQLSIATPFGGYKDSGLGREKGIGGLRLYQQSKSLYLGL
jgi:acyl-CoA reductase-like NAD-dependent aldehyde dehydrogenase